jgi:type IV pilus assembly protein PilW
MAAGQARGFNLPELMVSMAIGLVLLAAFIKVLDRCRSDFAVNESLARLQDAARHALSVLVPDLEHAGFYGVTSTPRVRLMRDGNVMAEATALWQPDAARAVPPARGLPTGAHDCGINLAVDLELPVQGANNAFVPGASASDCAPTASAGGARSGADTLVVRHASLATAAARAGRVQLYARRTDSQGMAMLFADGRAPGPLDLTSEIRDVEVHIYYVAKSSVGRPGWPALRVKSLTESRAAAQYRDEEVLPGVEDLQVEFGVSVPGDTALQYVAPDFPQLRERQVVAVRLWLRIRADATERGFADPRTLRYADVEFTPTSAEASQRRMLVERTVALRNLPAS